MSERNAQRLAARLERDRPKITEADVEEYRRVHYPDHATGREDGFLGDGYVARLTHDRFHEWFGTECDDTCPHPRPPRRVTWWRRLFGGRSRSLPRAVARRP